MEIKEPSFVTIEGRRMAFDEVCPPDPKGTILLLTGLASKRLGWYKQLSVFGQSYRTIALDYREVGDSDMTHRPYTIADLADDAAAVLKALNIPQAHIVGISMGGFVTLQLALRHPKLIHKLVLTSTSAGGRVHVAPSVSMLTMLSRLTPQPVEPGEQARRNYTKIMAPGYAQKHPEDLDIIAAIARHRPQPTAAYFRQLQAGTMHDVVRKLCNIQAPTLVIHGASDPLVPPPNGHYLARHIKGAKLLLYPGVGHIPIIERAEEFNRDVLAFLEQR